MDLKTFILRIQSETKMNCCSYRPKNLFQDKKKYFEEKRLLTHVLTKGSKQKSKEHYK